MHEINLRHSFVKLNGTFVHLAQYGREASIVKSKCAPPSPSSSKASIDGPPPQSKSSSRINSSSLNGPKEETMSFVARELIVFIPGNPGILGVYHDFLTNLFKTIVPNSNKSNSPVILAIGHNDFDHPDDCDYNADEKIHVGYEELNFVEKSIVKDHKPHDVEIQVLNKLIILKRLLKVNYSDCRLVFIGHSVGCYVILKLLQDKTLNSAHVGSILIHPALENLALTEKGAVISRNLNFGMGSVAKLAAYIGEKVLPNWAKLSLTKWFCSSEFVKSSSNIVIESLMQLACYNSVNALIEMAKSEFAQIKDMDHETMVKGQVDKLKLVYALGDHWVNASNRDELRRLYPNLHVEEQPTLHAFIMDPKVVSNYAVKVGMFIDDFFD